MEDNINELKQILGDIKPFKAILFGSYAYETQTNDSDIDALKGLVEDKWGTVDIVIHSLAFADREDLKGRFVETSRAGFKMAMDISAYSLIAVCQSLKDCFSENASVMAMTYHGSQQVIQGYNVMGVAKAALEANCRYLASDLGKDGVRVNCISAGPIRTLAASGVPGLRDIFKVVEERAPLGRNIDQMDVGKTSVYLASDLASGVTGQILYVDSGMSTMAL